MHGDARVPNVLQHVEESDRKLRNEKDVFERRYQLPKLRDRKVGVLVRQRSAVVDSYVRAAIRNIGRMTRTFGST